LPCASRHPDARVGGCAHCPIRGAYRLPGIACSRKGEIASRAGWSLVGRRLFRWGDIGHGDIHEAVRVNRVAGCGLPHRRRVRLGEAEATYALTDAGEWIG